jgi:hypothetical protein
MNVIRERLAFYSDKVDLINEVPVSVPREHREIVVRAGRFARVGARRSILVRRSDRRCAVWEIRDRPVL